MNRDMFYHAHQMSRIVTFFSSLGRALSCCLCPVNRKQIMMTSPTTFQRRQPSSDGMDMIYFTRTTAVQMQLKNRSYQV